MIRAQPSHPNCARFWPIGFGTAEGLQQDFTRGIWPHVLGCVGNTKPPTGQHPSCRPHPSQLPRFLPPSSTPLQRHSTTIAIANKTLSTNSSCEICQNLRNLSTNNQEPSLRMTIRSPDRALPRYLLPNDFPPNRFACFACFLFFALLRHHVYSTSCFHFLSICCFMFFAIIAA